MIDLHCHTKQRSECSHVDEDDLIRRAMERGLDGVAFTDHNRLAPVERLRELNEIYSPFRIFTGIEITLDTSLDAMDFVVLGLHDERLEACWPPWSDEKYEILRREGIAPPPAVLRRWDYPKLRAFVRRRGGYMVLAHPFRFGPDMPDEVMRDPPDAIELHSTNIPDVDAPRIRALAKQWHCPMLGVSDAHEGRHVGRYAVRLSAPVHTDRELIECLRKDAFQLVVPTES